MVKVKGHRRVKDPSAGGKRAPMETSAPQAPLGFDEPAGEAWRAGPADGLQSGAEVIAQAARTLPASPGVYRMLDKKGDALYVGKAANLKKRVQTYAQLAKLPVRLQRMVAATKRVEVVTTTSEVEALLLESNLIKRLRPRYNVLLRDDKSFPYILLTGDSDYPRIVKHRGAQSRQGRYFGPFASAGAVNRTITALEKAFLLRSCSEAVFNSRTRPCLMYQIKRCSAPCVGRISKADYDKLVRQARRFLSGGSKAIQRELAERMEAAAEAMDYETAAVYRDRIRALSHVQAHQDINLEGVEDADVIALHQEGGQSCIQVFFFRAGRNYGNRAYFPSHDKQEAPDAVVSAFTAQFYDNKPPPREVLVSHEPEERDLLEEALSLRAERRVNLRAPQRGAKKKLIEHARLNAREALARRLAESSTQRKLLEELAETLGLDAAPERIEVYDNSHIQGANPYGAMIVAGPEGFQKSAYRKFSIRGGDKDEPGGDDYAMMREVLTRRFTRAQKEDPDRDKGQWPDLVLIDGGKGQLGVAEEVFAELGVEDVALAAVAKGPDRDAGRERIFLPERAKPLLLKPKDPVLYFIQRLRDEAHRFAIGSHRTGRKKSLARSPLDEVPGIGAKRKKALLHHFGSARAVSQAGVADLAAVEGISDAVAKRIYDHFHAG